MIHRQSQSELERLLENFPVVGLIGPRQCGKSTLARHILANRPDSVYLDLERPSDLAKLSDPETFLVSQKGRLICIDEIQRKPELFPLLRSLTDDWGYPGAFLVLGSASRDLLRQSSESLAGRIAFRHLTPFLLEEISETATNESYYARGGFPRSLLAPDDGLSMEWRESFITTFLERDLLQWRNFTPALMGRLWQMLAHWNGQVMNYSTLGNALGVTSVTVKNYIDLLESTFMIKVLKPFTGNLAKRLVKSPKVYVADSGIASALLQLKNYGQLVGHPSWGGVWEQIILVNLQANFPDFTYSFYRTAQGAEIDLVLQRGETRIAVECKASVAPALTRGNKLALNDLNPTRSFVAAPVSHGWPLGENSHVVSIPELISTLAN